jgi:hypothetical protein
MGVKNFRRIGEQLVLEQPSLKGRQAGVNTMFDELSIR